MIYNLFCNQPVARIFSFGIPPFRRRRLMKTPQAVPTVNFPTGKATQALVFLSFNQLQRICGNNSHRPIRPSPLSPPRRALHLGEKTAAELVTCSPPGRRARQHHVSGRTVRPAAAAWRQSSTTAWTRVVCIAYRRPAAAACWCSKPRPSRRTSPAHRELSDSARLRAKRKARTAISVDGASRC